MTQNDTVPEPRHMQTRRSGASRKLLSRKAGDRAMVAQGEALEEVFPGRDAEATAGPAAERSALEALGNEHSPAASASTTGEPAGPDQLAVNGAPDAPTPSQGSTSAAGLPWSEEDERAFSTMAARRKASGYQRRGWDMGGQLLCVGGIAPNPGTVVATIVELFNTRNTMARTELLDAIAAASFSNAKAKPADRSWANGYVAGALRDGFLAVATADEAGVETSPAVSL